MLLLSHRQGLLWVCLDIQGWLCDLSIFVAGCDLTDLETYECGSSAGADHYYVWDGVRT